VSPPRTRIVLVDDHALFIAGIRSLLEQQADLEIVGEAGSGIEAVKVVRQTSPDLVITDATMPGMNGIDATREILAESPHVKVLCVTMHGNRHFVTAVLEAGAAGYLLKECAHEELIRAIEAVMAGKTYISPSVAGIVVASLKEGRAEPELSVFSLLTTRERQVLQLLAEGHSTKEIAGTLNLSVKTIGSHRERTMQKLSINSVAGLTKYAVRQGLTSIERDA